MYLIKKFFILSLLITIGSIIFSIINLLTSNYNPYLSFISISLAKNTLTTDSLMIEKSKVWSSSHMLDVEAEHYSFYGFLKSDTLKKYSLDWQVGNNPLKFVKEYEKQGVKLQFIPVLKSKIQSFSVYPIEDKNYMLHELIEDFIAVLFSSIPLITIPIYSYLFYSNYKKNKK